MAGAALFLGAAEPARAFWIFTPSQSRGRSLSELGIPPEWRSRLGSSLPEYAAFLQRLKLRRITVRQIIEPHIKQRGQVANTLPPKSMWRNMVPTLRVLDRLAVVVGEPVDEIISAYRTPAYNRSCGSSSRSQHLRNTALDIKFKASPRTVASITRELRDRGLFRGGVGRYYGFTHIDTRGDNADW